VNFCSPDEKRTVWHVRKIIQQTVLHLPGFWFKHHRTYWTFAIPKQRRFLTDRRYVIFHISHLGSRKRMIQVSFIFDRPMRTTDSVISARARKCDRAKSQDRIQSGRERVHQKMNWQWPEGPIWHTKHDVTLLSFHLVWWVSSGFCEFSLSIFVTSFSSAYIRSSQKSLNFIFLPFFLFWFNADVQSPVSEWVQPLIRNLSQIDDESSDLEKQCLLSLLRKMTEEVLKILA